jgi:hypothetical protein
VYPHSLEAQPGNVASVSTACGGGRPVRLHEGAEPGQGVGESRETSGLALEDATGAAATAGEDLGHLTAGGGQINRHALPGTQDESPLLTFPAREERDPVRDQVGELLGHALEDWQVARRPAGDAR